MKRLSLVLFLVLMMVTFVIAAPQNTGPPISDQSISQILKFDSCVNYATGSDHVQVMNNADTSPGFGVNDMNSLSENLASYSNATSSVYFDDGTMARFANYITTEVAQTSPGITVPDGTATVFDTDGSLEVETILLTPNVISVISQKLTLNDQCAMLTFDDSCVNYAITDNTPPPVNSLEVETIQLIPNTAFWKNTTNYSDESSRATIFHECEITEFG